MLREDRRDLDCHIERFGEASATSRGVQCSPVADARSASLLVNNVYTLNSKRASIQQ
jgi:hypothetical protein